MLNDDWLSEIGKPSVCVHEKIDWQEDVIPTRLVIFESGVKIDFSFYPTKVLKALARNTLPDEFAAGYQVLVDKDGVASAMPPPSDSCYQQSPPSQNEFQRIIEEFWFEAYHVTKYLVRGDLWSVKFRDNGLKQEFLLQMIRWHAQAKHEWKYTTHTQGKRIQEWVDGETWNELQQCFGNFKENDNWHALKHTMALFRRLSHKTAKMLDFEYLGALEQRMTLLIEQLCRTEESKNVLAANIMITEEVQSSDKEPISQIIEEFLSEHLSWWQQTYGTDAALREGSVEKQWNAFFKAVDDPSKLVLIAKSNDRVIIGLGWACIKPEEWLECDIGYVNLIALTPKWQRQGVGSQLMHSIQDWFKSKGVEGQQLNVSAHNHHAISLYERFGFSVTDYHMLGPGSTL